MTSPLSTSLSLAFVSLSSLALYTGSASASTCGAPAARWNPELTWPAACEIDVAVDGYVLLEGEPLEADAPGGEGTLEVMVQRVQNGQPVETFAGSVTQPDETSALFHSERPLAPNADYVVVAQRRGADGQPVGDRFSSAFTTGSRTLAPVRFRSTPTVQVERGEHERHECVTDACGQEQCEPTGETVEGQLVRVAVPALEGGIALKPYKIEAELQVKTPSAQAPVVATATVAAMQAGQRSFVTVDVPSLREAGEGCVVVKATDAAGHEVKSAPVCVPVAAETAPTPSQQSAESDLSELAYSATADDVRDENGAQVSDAAGGCSVASGAGNASGFAWIALVLGLAGVRSRKHTR